MTALAAIAPDMRGLSPDPAIPHISDPFAGVRLEAPEAVGPAFATLADGLVAVAGLDWAEAPLPEERDGPADAWEVALASHVAYLSIPPDLDPGPETDARTPDATDPDVDGEGEGECATAVPLLLAMAGAVRASPACEVLDREPLAPWLFVARLDDSAGCFSPSASDGAWWAAFAFVPDDLFGAGRHFPPPSWAVPLSGRERLPATLADLRALVAEAIPAARPGGIAVLDATRDDTWRLEEELAVTCGLHDIQAEVVGLVADQVRRAAEMPGVPNARRAA